MEGRQSGLDDEKRWWDDKERGDRGRGGDNGGEMVEVISSKVMGNVVTEEGDERGRGHMGQLGRNDWVGSLG